MERKFFPYIKKKRFYSFLAKKSHSVFLPSMYMYFYSWIKRTFSTIKKPKDWFISHPLVQRSIIPRITWIGHASFLIQIGGLNILTDPIFGNASLLFKRIFPPGIALKDIVPIDLVLLSHNHRDHMDASSLESLKRFDPLILIPDGLKYWFESRSFKNTFEHTWWQEMTVKAKDACNGIIKCSFLPSAHWSQRGLFDRNKSLWGSWLIQYRNFKIYFAGDTAYEDHFCEISRLHSNIDVALLPIGPCEPRKWMSHSHLSAEQAGKAFLDLKAKHFIPMHWGTFYFGVDNFMTPVHQVQNWWKKHLFTLNEKKLHLMKFGQALEFNL